MGGVLQGSPEGTPVGSYGGCSHLNSESSPSSQVPESQTLKTKFPVVHVFSEGVSSPRTKRVARGKKIQAIKKNDTPPTHTGK